jgi:hypothetical protein
LILRERTEFDENKLCLLWDQGRVTQGGKIATNTRDAQGFIRLTALSLRTLGKRRHKLAK